MSEPSPGPNTTMRPLMRASSRPTGRRDRAIALSDAAMSARCGDHELTSEDAAYLRDRVAMHLSIGGAVGALFLLAAILYGVLVELVSLEAIILHLAAVVLVGAVVLFLRIRPPSAKASRIGEAVGLFGSFVFYGTIAALNGPDLFPVETLILIYCMALIGRSVFTPSTAVQTGVLAAITASPFVGVTVFRAAESTGPFWSELLLPLVWYVAIGGLAVAVSRVTFGLRSEVQAAKRLGQYTLVEKIGEGGMGWVYRGHHAMLRRDTAIKIMSDPADGGKTARRFEREVRLTARLSHPNTVTVFDYGRTKDGLFYYAMELIDGATLQDIVEKTGPMEPSRVVHVLRQVASALGEAHDLGLIHRDIKPTNIMLARVGGIRDVAKVLDFGLVRDLDASGGTRSEANTVVGTPDYMAPELINNPDEVDHRADLYALGAVGYYLLTGQRLFEAGSAIEVCAHQLHSRPTPVEEVAPSDVPFALASLIESCLHKVPSDRPGSAEQLLEALENMRNAVWTPQECRAWWDSHDALFVRAVTSEAVASPAVPSPDRAAVDRSASVDAPDSHPRDEAPSSMATAPTVESDRDAVLGMQKPRTI